MNFFVVKCPHCNADLKPVDGLETFFCPYCGGKVILEGQNKDVLRAKVREYDSLRVKREKDEDLEREYWRKEKELEYKRKKEIEENKSIFRAFKPFFIFLIFLICGCILLSITDEVNEKKETKQRQQQQLLINAMEDKTVKIGISSYDFNNMKYTDAKDYFKRLGFIYVDTLEIQHNEADNKVKNGVAYITIDGNRSFDANSTFPLDAKIYIAYYSSFYSSK